MIHSQLADLKRIFTFQGKTGQLIQVAYKKVGSRRRNLLHFAAGEMSCNYRHFPSENHKASMDCLVGQHVQSDNKL